MLFSQLYDVWNDSPGRDVKHCDGAGIWAYSHRHFVQGSTGINMVVCYYTNKQLDPSGESVIKDGTYVGSGKDS